MIDRPRVDGVGVEDRGADIAQGLVHGMRQRMHDGRLLQAGDDDAGAPMSAQIVGDRPEPSCVVPLRAADAGAWSGPDLDAQLLRQRKGEAG